MTDLAYIHFLDYMIGLLILASYVMIILKKVPGLFVWAGAYAGSAVFCAVNSIYIEALFLTCFAAVSVFGIIYWMKGN